MVVVSVLAFQGLLYDHAARRCTCPTTAKATRRCAKRRVTERTRTETTPRPSPQDPISTDTETDEPDLDLDAEEPGLIAEPDKDKPDEPEPVVVDLPGLPQVVDPQTALELAKAIRHAEKTPSLTEITPTAQIQPVLVDIQPRLPRVVDAGIALELEKLMEEVKQHPPPRLVFVEGKRTTKKFPSLVDVWQPVVSRPDVGQGIVELERRRHRNPAAPRLVDIHQDLPNGQETSAALTVDSRKQPWHQWEPALIDLRQQSSSPKAQPAVVNVEGRVQQASLPTAVTMQRQRLEGQQESSRRLVELQRRLPTTNSGAPSQIDIYQGFSKGKETVAAVAVDNRQRPLHQPQPAFIDLRHQSSSHRDSETPAAVTVEGRMRQRKQQTATTIQLQNADGQPHAPNQWTLELERRQHSNSATSSFIDIRQPLPNNRDREMPETSATLTVNSRNNALHQPEPALIDMRQHSYSPKDSDQSASLTVEGRRRQAKQSIVTSIQLQNAEGQTHSSNQRTLEIERRQHINPAAPTLIDIRQPLQYNRQTPVTSASLTVNSRNPALHLPEPALIDMQHHSYSPKNTDKQAAVTVEGRMQHEKQPTVATIQLQNAETQPHSSSQWTVEMEKRQHSNWPASSLIDIRQPQSNKRATPVASASLTVTSRSSAKHQRKPFVIDVRQHSFSPKDSDQPASMTVEGRTRLEKQPTVTTIQLQSADGQPHSSGQWTLEMERRQHSNSAASSLIDIRQSLPNNRQTPATSASLMVVNSRKAERNLPEPALIDMRQHSFSPKDSDQPASMTVEGRRRLAKQPTVSTIQLQSADSSQGHSHSSQWSVELERKQHSNPASHPSFIDIQQPLSKSRLASVTSASLTVNSRKRPLHLAEPVLINVQQHPYFPKHADKPAAVTVEGRTPQANHVPTPVTIEQPSVEVQPDSRTIHSLHVDGRQEGSLPRNRLIDIRELLPKERQSSVTRQSIVVLHRGQHQHHHHGSEIEMVKDGSSQTDTLQPALKPTERQVLVSARRKLVNEKPRGQEEVILQSMDEKEDEDDEDDDQQYLQIATSSKGSKSPQLSPHEIEALVVQGEEDTAENSELSLLNSLRQSHLHPKLQVLLQKQIRSSDSSPPLHLTVQTEEHRHRKDDGKSIIVLSQEPSAEEAAQVEEDLVLVESSEVSGEGEGLDEIVIESGPVEAPTAPPAPVQLELSASGPLSTRSRRHLILTEQSAGSKSPENGTTQIKLTVTSSTEQAKSSSTAVFLDEAQGSQRRDPGKRTFELLATEPWEAARRGHVRLTEEESLRNKARLDPELALVNRLAGNAVNGRLVITLDEGSNSPVPVNSTDGQTVELLRTNQVHQPAEEVGIAEAKSRVLPNSQGVGILFVNGRKRPHHRSDAVTLRLDEEKKTLGQETPVVGILSVNAQKSTKDQSNRRAEIELGAADRPRSSQDRGKLNLAVAETRTDQETLVDATAIEETLEETSARSSPEKQTTIELSGPPVANPLVSTIYMESLTQRQAKPAQTQAEVVVAVSKPRPKPSPTYAVESEVQESTVQKDQSNDTVETLANRPSKHQHLNIETSEISGIVTEETEPEMVKIVTTATDGLSTNSIVVEEGRQEENFETSSVLGQEVFAAGAGKDKPKLSMMELEEAEYAQKKTGLAEISKIVGADHRNTRPKSTEAVIEEDETYASQPGTVLPRIAKVVATRQQHQTTAPDVAIIEETQQRSVQVPHILPEIVAADKQQTHHPPALETVVEETEERTNAASEEPSRQAKISFVIGPAEKESHLAIVEETEKSRTETKDSHPEQTVVQIAGPLKQHKSLLRRFYVTEMQEKKALAIPRSQEMTEITAQDGRSKSHPIDTIVLSEEHVGRPQAPPKPTHIQITTERHRHHQPSAVTIVEETEEGTNVEPQEHTKLAKISFVNDPEEKQPHLAIVEEVRTETNPAVPEQTVVQVVDPSNPSKHQLRPVHITEEQEKSATFKLSNTAPEATEIVELPEPSSHHHELDVLEEESSKVTGPGSVEEKAEITAVGEKSKSQPVDAIALSEEQERSHRPATLTRTQITTDKQQTHQPPAVETVVEETEEGTNVANGQDTDLATISFVKGPEEKQRHLAIVEEARTETNPAVPEQTVVQAVDPSRPSKPQLRPVFITEMQEKNARAPEATELVELSEPSAHHHELDVLEEEASDLTGLGSVEEKAEISAVDERIRSPPVNAIVVSEKQEHSHHPPTQTRALITADKAQTDIPTALETVVEETDEGKNVASEDETEVAKISFVNGPAEKQSQLAIVGEAVRSRTLAAVPERTIVQVVAPTSHESLLRPVYITEEQENRPLRPQETEVYLRPRPSHNHQEVMFVKETPQQPSTPDAATIVEQLEPALQHRDLSVVKEDSKLVIPESDRPEEKAEITAIGESHKSPTVNAIVLSEELEHRPKQHRLQVALLATEKKQIPPCNGSCLSDYGSSRCQADEGDRHRRDPQTNFGCPPI